MATALLEPENPMTNCLLNKAYLYHATQAIDDSSQKL